MSEDEVSGEATEFILLSTRKRPVPNGLPQSTVFKHLFKPAQGSVDSLCPVSTALVEAGSAGSLLIVSLHSTVDHLEPSVSQEPTVLSAFASLQDEAQSDGCLKSLCILR